MEFSLFNTPLKTEDLVSLSMDLLRQKGELVVRTGDQQLGAIVGVSDGRKVAINTLCFLEGPTTLENLERLKQALIIANPTASSFLNGCSHLIVADPRALYIDLLNRISVVPGFSCFTSLIADIPFIHPSAEIHPSAVIEEGVYIGSDTRVSAGCVIKRGTHLGVNVTIRENTVIGCDGIALYKTMDGRVLHFPHLAGVIVGDGVEIGASCVVPRGVMCATQIGDDAVIGNLCNLGHSVRIGRKVWMSVGCLIGGNTTIGELSTLGLGVCVRDNLHMGKNCSVGMGSVLVKDLPDNSSAFGNPARRLPGVNAGPNR